MLGSEQIQTINNSLEGNTLFMSNMVKKITQLFYKLLILFILLIIFYKCPFSYIFGIPCPGCGMTRALFSLITLDFASAFYYHPLFPIVILVFIFLFLEYLGLVSLSDKTKNRFLVIIAIIFIITYFIRMYTGSPIVATKFSKSLAHKIYVFMKTKV